MLLFTIFIWRMIIVDKECSYGCGKIGVYELKNGNRCCEKFSSQCVKIREKNSIGVKQSDQLRGGRNQKLIYQSQSEEQKRRQAWSSGKTIFNDGRLNKKDGIKLRIKD